METSVTFELATILDAIKKAAIVAPARAGTAFDKAAGVMLDLFPSDEVKVVIRATNLDSFYTEVIECVTISGDATQWRVPANLVAEVLGNITQSPGKTVKFTRSSATGGRVWIQCGRMKATIGLIDPHLYPEFPRYEGEYSTAGSIGGSIELVSWAAGKAGTEPLSGVHFTGKHLLATDRYRVARVPLEMPISNPVTLPASMLGSLLKRGGDLHIGATDHQVFFRIDDYTLVACAIFPMAYPEINKRLNGMQYDGTFVVRKSSFIRLVNQVIVAAQGNRSPIMQMIIGKSELAAFLKGQEAGIGDVEDLPGQVDHPRVSHYYEPTYLVDAANRAPGDLLTFSYKRENEPKTPIKVEDGTGYEAWVMPRKSLDNGGGA